MHALAVLVSGHEVVRGANMLTLRELGVRLDALNRLGFVDQARTFALNYHIRLAGALMPVVFSLFALGVATVTRGAARSIAIGLTAPVATLVYGVLFISLGFGAWLPAFAVVWIPNLLFGAMTIVLLMQPVHNGPA
jgi:lipopolysaccharide export LptBFGC system permease protein LptF